MFCKKCGNKLTDDAAFCEKCGTPTGAAGAAQPTPSAEPAEAGTPPVEGSAPVEASAPAEAPAAEQSAEAAAAPPPPTAPEKKKSKKGLIIGIIVAVVAVICIGGFVLGGSGGGTDPIVGHWGMIAFADQDNDNEVTPVAASKRSSFYVDFNADATGTLSIGDSTYAFTWKHYPEMTERLDSGTAYKLDIDDLSTTTTATLTEVDGEDTVFILISGLQYGMIYQK